MPGSGQLWVGSEFCKECRSGAHLSRYAGILGQCVEELVRATSRQADSAHHGAFDERWRALLSARCGQCGAYLAEQWIDAEALSIDTLSDPEDLRRFPQIGVLDPYFLATADQRTLLCGVVDAALEHSSADMSNMQLVAPAKSGLFIAAHHGFDNRFLDFFAWVADSGTACAAAASRRAKVIVPDVAHSPLFTGESRQAMLDARAQAVQSIPLVSSAGYLLGILSCHYREPGRPTDEDDPLLDALARAAVRSLQWRARHVGQARRATGPVDCSEDGWKADQPPTGSGELVAEIRKIVTEVHGLLDGPT